MKRKIATLLFIFCFVFSFPAFAAGNLEIKATVNGTVEKGSQVEILIDISEIKSLYAASFYFKYDPTVLKIEEIIPGELISDSKIGKFEAVKTIDESKGLVSYGFTCLGNINGFSGDGNLLKLRATVLDNKDINITSNFGNKAPTEKYNLAMQICDKSIEELPYTFKPYKYTAPKVQASSGEGNNTLNNNTTNNNTPEEKENSSNTATEVKDQEAKEDNVIVENNKEENPSDAGAGNKDVSKSSQYNNKVQDASKKLVYVIGALGIVMLMGFGIYKVKNKNNSK